MPPPPRDRPGESGGAPRGPAAEPDATLLTARALAERCSYEREHTDQVVRLSLELFDALSALHGRGEGDRRRLHFAALLHDIGVPEGTKGHHKRAAAKVLEDPGLALDRRERLVVGSVARYHRKALPRQDHEHFAALPAEDQDRVRCLAAILRVADGLDRSHRGLVRHVAAEVRPDAIIVRCQADAPPGEDLAAALKKGDLMEAVFGRRLRIEVVP
jgi:exopolyphosphatase/guanosine-5'-triphosphate,3'-diphosphate pyrophosphatase